MELLKYYAKMRISKSDQRKIYILYKYLFTHDVPGFILFEDHDMKFDFLLDKNLVNKIKEPRGFYLMMENIKSGIVCCPVIEEKPYLVLEKEEDFNIEKYLSSKQVDTFIGVDDFIPTLTGNQQLYYRNNYLFMALFASLEAANAEFKTHPNFNPYWETYIASFLRWLRFADLDPIKTGDKFETGLMYFTANNSEKQKTIVYLQNNKERI